MAQTVSGVQVAGAQAFKGYAPKLIRQLPSLANLSGLFTGGAGPGDGALENWLTENTQRGLKGILNGGPLTDGLGCVRLPTSAWIDTRITETNAFTIMQAFMIEEDQTVNVGLSGTYKSLADPGFGVFVLPASPTIIRAEVGKATGFAGVTLGGYVPGTWNVISLAIPATGAYVLRNHTLGTSVTSANTDARITQTIDNLRIGSLPAAGFNGPFWHGMLAPWRGVRNTGDFLTAQYLAWKAHAMAAYGLVW
jgi:hypothetical protein